MAIEGTEGLTLAQLQDELQRGGKFVVYEYCVSLLVITFKRSSKIYFVRANQSAAANGLVYIFISLAFGWWGIPWGPIFTITSLATDFGGGRDVTANVMNQFMRYAPPPPYQYNRM